MSKKLISLIFFVLVLGLVLPSVVEAGDPNLMGWWKLDGNALDSSGNERHGLLQGDPQFVAGIFNEAVELDGDGDFVTITGYKGVLGTHPWSITAWIKATDVSDHRAFINWGSSGGGQRIEIRMMSGGGTLRANHGNGYVATNTAVNDGQWHHIAVTSIEAAITQYPDMIFYVDGKDDTPPRTDTDPLDIIPSSDVSIGMRGTHGDRYWLGSIDEVTMYDKVLTPEEVVQVMNGNILPPSTPASNPKPSDKATDVSRDVVLSWTPGVYAPPTNGHKVYLSENFSDVNDGIGGITQDANSYARPQRLDLGKAYYWRVDEANSTTGWDQGEIWQFATEPVAYAIGNITVTASSQVVDREPENTINGSGLDDSGLLHGNVGDLNMWLSDAAGPQPSWIEFQFDKVYKLHEMWVWNANETLEPVIGLGFKDVTIEYSTNGTDYATLGTTHEFARAPGTPDYEHNTTVDFGGVTAKQVRLTANSSWGGLLPQFGLSEVRFFYIPLRAREPSPDSGATDVDVDVTLSFRAGREAAQHDAYLSTDEQAVIDATAPVTTVPETSYGPLSLDLAQTYYWKVNEVNMAETPTTLEGDVWNLTTREFLVVDDFESYNDLDTTDPESNRIFLTWLDGYGVATNGSIVGYANPPFAEQTIVHSGAQSMPLFYDNTGTARYSEAELALSAAQDWTKSGITALSLWFSGDPNNIPDKMYVKINGSKVTYDGEAGNLMLRPWQPWNIDLASLGIGLQNVTKLSIGFGDETSVTPGGSGVVFFDDISLYPYSRQFVTPAEPAPGNLVAHYEFEGTASDSSGNGLHGTAMGAPTFVAGKVGQAISLDGLDDFVEITGYKGILGPNAVTVTAWINTTNTETGAIVGWGPSVDGQRFGFRIDDDRMRIEHAGGNVQGDSTVNDGKWHHVAVTVQEGVTISYPDVILYVDGIDDTRATVDPELFNLTADQDVRIGSRPSSNDRFFMGLIDDVRIYDRALTREEVAWLAGRTEPFDKPF
jgi:hypothetical protein